MDKTLWARVLNFDSDNRKSKIQNRKLVGLSVMAFVLVVAGAVAEAQQPKIPRIGFSSAGPLSSMSARIDAFRQRLRELGYVEGKNIVIEYRFAEGKPDQVANNVTELV